MARKLKEWNEYLDHLKELQDKIYEGTKTVNGLCIQLSMEECDILWDLVKSEAMKVNASSFDYYKYDPVKNE